MTLNVVASADGVGRTYLMNAGIDRLVISHSLRDSSFDASIVENAALRANEIIERISRFEVDIFKILGMRNLSAFVGEVFAESVASISEGRFISNPHQDGYPDLLLLDDEGLAEYERLALFLTEKAPFSPFLTGGVEVKATCGSVPAPSVLARRGLTKPGLGDQRINLMNSYDWKAHHRETNNLLGLLWDFIDGIPVIVAVFFSSRLEESDWGNIVTPTAGGGRTTSVSIMSRSGIRKMYEGWLCVLQDERYISFLNRRNAASLIPAAATR